MALGAEPSTVRIVRERDAYRMLKNERPYFIKGAGGGAHLDQLAAAGGNSVRTWHAKDLPSLLDQAHELGLTVTVGLWLPHQRHGFDYSDDAAVSNVVDKALQVVQCYKDHPAVLMWGIGNEMEGDGSDARVWQTVNKIAKRIEAVDPNHPTMTVVAGATQDKIRKFIAQCPDVDVLGINAYGDLRWLPEELKRQGLDRPYIVTEFGPTGWWQVAKTPWGEEIEPTSTQKAGTYLESYTTAVAEQAGSCLGSYAFLWGNKQEHTCTWFGMFLPGGERTAAVDAMTFAWTGRWPMNRCPQITSLRIKEAGQNTFVDIPEQCVFQPGARLESVVDARDPDNDPLTFRWELRSASTDKRTGGDPEQAPPTHRKAIINVDGPAVTLQVLDEPGAYRVFVYVLDGKGNAATANVPILVK
jgi:hypothetical protein